MSSNAYASLWCVSNIMLTRHQFFSFYDYVLDGPKSSLV